MIFVFDRIENMGKRENSGYPHFLPLPSIFQRVLTQGRYRFRLYGKELAHYQMTEF